MKARTAERGYGAAHARLRKRWAPYVATGTIPCARCGALIRSGEKWHLDHSEDRTTYLGPSHVRCNVVAPRQAKDPAPAPTTIW